ncbi:MEDS domain-containing protein [Micromonospora sp. NPDC005367]|uniref:MEDS domain-containing protein n=1 Tax=Micromonospora sp. NPDC005367 TaxID=3155590 RepID=UPI00339DDD0F
MTVAAVVDQLRLGEHVCRTYDDEAGTLDAVGRSVTAGPRLVRKAPCFLDRLTADAVRAGRTARGVPTREALADGRLRLLPADADYRPDGRFDRARMIVTLRAEGNRAQQEEYAGSTVVGDMAWAARGGAEAGHLWASLLRAYRTRSPARSPVVLDVSDESFADVRAAHTLLRADATEGDPGTRGRLPSPPRHPPRRGGNPRDPRAGAPPVDVPF